MRVLVAASTKHQKFAPFLDVFFGLRVGKVDSIPTLNLGLVQSQLQSMVKPFQRNYLFKDKIIKQVSPFA